MSEQETLNEVLKKVRELHDLMHGDSDRPGVTHRLKELESSHFGVAGQWGIRHKVEIMWRGHIWLLCSLSAVSGWAAKSYLDKIIQ